MCTAFNVVFPCSRNTCFSPVFLPSCAVPWAFPSLMIRIFPTMSSLSHARRSTGSRSPRRGAKVMQSHITCPSTTVQPRFQVLSDLRKDRVGKHIWYSSLWQIWRLRIYVLPASSDKQGNPFQLIDLPCNFHCTDILAPAGTYFASGNLKELSDESRSAHSRWGRRRNIKARFHCLRVLRQPLRLRLSNKSFFFSLSTLSFSRCQGAEGPLYTYTIVNLHSVRRALAPSRLSFCDHFQLFVCFY